MKRMKKRTTTSHPYLPRGPLVTGRRDSQERGTDKLQEDVQRVPTRDDAATRLRSHCDGFSRRRPHGPEAG